VSSLSLDTECKVSAASSGNLTISAMKLQMDEECKWFSL
jgi:hypothetical protein